MGFLFPDSIWGQQFSTKNTHDFSDEKGANLQRFGDGRFVSKARSMGPFPKWMLNGGGVRTSPTCPNKQLTHPDRQKAIIDYHRIFYPKRPRGI